MIKLNSNTFFTGLTQVAAVLATRKDFYDNTKNSVLVDFFNGDPIPFGQSVVRRSVKLPIVSDYTEDSSLLSVVKPTIIEDEYKINNKKKIQLTYSTELMASCFLNDDGLNMFISDILKQMTNAMILTKYNALVKAIKDAYDPSKANKITLQTSNGVLDLTTYAKGDIMQIINSLGFLSTEKASSNNYIAIVNNTQIMNYLNSLDFNKFNLNIKTFMVDKLELGTNTPLLVLIPREAVVMHDKLITYANFVDWSNLMVNNFLHFWFICDIDKNYDIKYIESDK